MARNDPVMYKTVRQLLISDLKQEETEERRPLHLQHIINIKPNSQSSVWVTANIAENYPPETWTHVYTDRSATKAITDGGAVIIIQYPSGATQTASSAEL